MQAAYPSRALVNVVGGYFTDDPRPDRGEAQLHETYIRKLRAGSIAQPDLEKSWSVGHALSTLSRKRWVNPLLMLFACGHYGHVADLLVKMSDADISIGRRASMALTLPTVLFEEKDLAAPSVAETRAAIVASGPAGAHDLIAQMALQREAAMPPAERNDRIIWSLDMHAYTALLVGWDRIRTCGLDMANPAIATSQLIAERAIYPVTDRNRIVSGLIADALR